MRWLALLLLVTVALSSSSSDVLVVFADTSNCAHLECEWRGVGERCKPASRLRALKPDAIGRTFRFLSKNESEAGLLARIKASYPVNTFTFLNHFALGEECGERRLFCNVDKAYFYDDYGTFLRRLQSPDPRVRPLFQC